MSQVKNKEPRVVCYNLDVPPLMMTYRPKRRPDIQTRVVDGQTVVLDPGEEFVHQINKTASYIWERCNGHRTPEEITCEVCEVFDVDFPTARRDVLATVDRLRRSKLLEES
ncbi:MAG TPA: PqqD family protein [Candidatus Binatia bacterium]|jgi:hypothetical protein